MVLEPSTSAAAAATPANDEVQEGAEAPHLPVPQQQSEEQVIFNGPATLKQCHQLFVAPCRVKVERCQLPIPISPQTSDCSSSDGKDDARVFAPTSCVPPTKRKAVPTTPVVENHATVAVPSSDGRPANSRVVAVSKVKNGRESPTGSGSGSDEDEVKVFHAPRAAAPSIAKKKSAEKRYRCDKCKKSFWKRTTFLLHKKARDQRNGVCPRTNRKKFEGWRPKGAWTCEICGKRLKQGNYYISHMRNHWGEKLYKCEECGKAFNRNSVLTNHERIHSQVWQFTCLFCGKGFNQKGNYFCHLRGHAEEKPYFCKVKGCGASFRQHDTLNYHRRRVHL